MMDIHKIRFIRSSDQFEHLQEGLTVPSQHTTRPFSQPQAPPWLEQHPFRISAAMAMKRITTIKASDNFIIKSYLFKMLLS
jgi:hypothetical protein